MSAANIPSPAQMAAVAVLCPAVRVVVLFGSLARDTARPDSDADIGILGGAFWDQLKLGSAIGNLLGREPHVVDLATSSDLLRYEVARDGVPLFEGEAFAWARFQAESAVRYFDVAPMIALCAEGVKKRLARQVPSRG